MVHERSSSDAICPEALENKAQHRQSGIRGTKVQNVGILIGSLKYATGHANGGQSLNDRVSSKLQQEDISATSASSEVRGYQI